MAQDLVTLLHGLNAAQQEAVTLPLDRHGVILSGAGTGKTRVIIHRIAFAIQSGVPASGIVAVTFTNKAAQEMRDRLVRMVGEETANQVRMGTFHGLGVRFLRRYGQHAGILKPAAIRPMDEDESVALLRRVMKDRFPDVDIKTEKPKDHYRVINHWKDLGYTAERPPESRRFSDDLTKRLFLAYEEEKSASQALDFADLIVFTNRILRTQEGIRTAVQSGLRLVLVDEFQDTNPIQAEFIHLLTGSGAAVPAFVVGDDDQSIYGWRGADSAIFQDFIGTFTPNTLVRLEENYRCTGVVLDAANAVIAHNKDRIGKTLFTRREDVGPFELSGYADADTEAAAIADQIMDIQRKRKANGRDIVVLYRKNAISRGIEKALLQRGLPYRVYGGVNFYQRREIRDALAWLRVVAHPADDPALIRAVGTPRRGIGSKTIAQWHKQARASKNPMWAILQSDRRKGAQEFVSTIADLRRVYQSDGLVRLVEQMTHRSGLRQFYVDSAQERGEEACENLAELVGAAGAFHHRLRTGGNMGESLARQPGDPLSEFLVETVMDAEAGNRGQQEDCISLMTIHKAKGLEYPYVFLAGLEEGELPCKSAIRAGDIAEERRLFYVALTRSQYATYLSYARNRLRFDSGNADEALDEEEEVIAHFDGSPSRFLREIPAHLLRQPDLVETAVVSARLSW